MNSPNEHHLNNPVFYSLSETHQPFAIGQGNIKFYQPDLCPFGGFETSDDISRQIDAYADLTDDFFIVGEKPVISNRLKLKKELVCLQMIIHNKIDIEVKENIVKLNDHYTDALFDLVSLVQPGYFRKCTYQLGDYYGIFKDDALVAIAGERMKMNGFVELSAIVTHPQHTGKGYAKQLIAFTVNRS